MVERAVAAGGVTDERVLDAMAEVPREVFLDATLAPRAYEDLALPIGESQSISQPALVARMLEAAHLGRTDRVLEVGTGSGYGTAVLSRLVRTVYSVERHASLSMDAARRLDELGYDNVSCVVGDGTVGLGRAAPFDAIIVSGASRAAPPRLLEQLATGARLVIPLGTEAEQTLMSILRVGGNRFVLERLARVRVAPLVFGDPFSGD
jgi:protein-L-isoaspartate(D-aspartate) O-methyltransferase